MLVKLVVDRYFLTIWAKVELHSKNIFMKRNVSDQENKLLFGLLERE